MELPGPGTFALALVISILCSVLVYMHAERQGSRHATAWGVFGFIFAAPGALAYMGYYLVSRRRRR